MSPVATPPGTVRIAKPRAASREDRDRWCAPPEVLVLVREVGPIVLDPCGDPGDVVEAAVSVHPPDDGLAISWAGLGDDGLVYCNPPYSDPAPWTAKMTAEADRGVLLLPSTPDVAWFHRLCRCPRVTALLLEGRLAFLREGAPVRGNRQGSVLALVSDREEDHARFIVLVEDLGMLVRRRTAGPTPCPAPLVTVSPPVTCDAPPSGVDPAVVRRLDALVTEIYVRRERVRPAGSAWEVALGLLEDLQEWERDELPTLVERHEHERAIAEERAEIVHLDAQLNARAEIAHLDAQLNARAKIAHLDAQLNAVLTRLRGLDGESAIRYREVVEELLAGAIS